MKPLLLALAVLMAPALTTAALAQQSAAKPAKSRGGAPGSPFGGMGGDSKEPIKIDANKLDVLDKDNKAVFSGNVVAVQGETTVRCSVMTVFYEGRGQGGRHLGRAHAESFRLWGRRAETDAEWRSFSKR